MRTLVVRISVFCILMICFSSQVLFAQSSKIKDIIDAIRDNPNDDNGWNKLYEYLSQDANIDNGYQVPINTICDELYSYYSNYWAYIYLTKARNDLQEKNGIQENNFYDKAKYFNRKEYLDTLLASIKNRYSYYLNQNFHSYAPPNLNNTWIKSAGFYFDNDLFQFRYKNEDRNYTGGGRVEVTTDMFKMRMPDIFWTRNILSYQTLFIGAEAYTPRVHYKPDDVAAYHDIEKLKYVDDDETNGELTDSSFLLVKKFLNDSFHCYDRPFASYYYFGRAKHRMKHNGAWRLSTEFKLGKIGTDAPKSVQALLHRDLLVESKKILLWENQIGNGGRFIFNFNADFDLRLLSSSTLKDNNFENSVSRKRATGLHLYMPIEVKFGSEVTSFGGGIRLQTRSIRDMNAKNELLKINRDTRSITNRDLISLKNKYARKRICNSFWSSIVFSAESKVRYVVHNSMLEGVGILTTFKNDQFDDDKRDYRILNDNGRKDEVSRLLFLHKFLMTYRLRHSSFSYGMTLVSPEFKLREAKWYGYGTLAFNYYL